MITIENLQVKNIAIVVSEENVDLLCSASSLYSYFLQLQKKVFFIYDGEILPQYNVIPWIEKIKRKIPSKVETTIQLTNTTHIFSLEVFKYFQNNHVKINEKMATALYIGIVSATENFTNEKTDGIVFASISTLLMLGAKKEYAKKIQEFYSLAQLRLQGRMFCSMELIENATIAFFEVTVDMLEKTGTKFQDAKFALKAALALPTVKYAIAVFKPLKGQYVIMSKPMDLKIESDDSINIKEKIIKEVRKIEKKK